MAAEREAYTLSFSSNDITRFFDAFSTLLLKITNSENKGATSFKREIPNFRITATSEKVTIRWLKTKESFLFFALLIKELNSFSITPGKTWVVSNKDVEETTKQSVYKVPEKLLGEPDADSEDEQTDPNAYFDESSIIEETCDTCSSEQLTAQETFDSEPEEKETSSKPKSTSEGAPRKGSKEKMIMSYILTLEDDFKLEDVFKHFEKKISYSYISVIIKKMCTLELLKKLPTSGYTVQDKIKAIMYYLRTLNYPFTSKAVSQTFKREITLEEANSIFENMFTIGVFEKVSKDEYVFSEYVEQFLAEK